MSAAGDWLAEAALGFSQWLSEEATPLDADEVEQFSIMFRVALDINQGNVDKNHMFSDLDYASAHFGEEWFIRLAADVS